ncbi:alpha/beta hydrolase family protein [Stackebrandtia albiflava]|uniref:Alpha/beta hydrolase family protein n=1 Tax=Stackebrandtia albiflava TaxID=406432 RepID=A0A562VDN6_9ACTN|nr:alpha/beta hydrolase [Stackebrandtia albiflava]TWJ15975.1 alpha/beta hydrolase family protein [Stackebrandtia albiflava]
MPTVRLSDDTPLEVTVTGRGPTLLLPENPAEATPETAERLRPWGTDPQLGHTLMTGLSDRFTVAAFDYVGHLMAHPRPDDLTPETVTADMLAVADAVGAERFAYYGYSWLGLSGLQLAIRTDRLWALATGGFPPLDGPYREMLAVTTATHRMAVENARAPETTTRASRTTAEDSGTGEDYDWDAAEATMSPEQSGQFTTLYRALADFDDRTVRYPPDLPRLCLVGESDRIDYGPRWGGVTVDLAGPVLRHRDTLTATGWRVAILPGLDHMKAMQPTHVLPVLRPFLTDAAP